MQLLDSKVSRIDYLQDQMTHSSQKYDNLTALVKNQ